MRGKINDKNFHLSGCNSCMERVTRWQFHYFGEIYFRSGDIQHEGKNLSQRYFSFPFPLKSYFTFHSHTNPNIFLFPLLHLTSDLFHLHATNSPQIRFTSKIVSHLSLIDAVSSRNIRREFMSAIFISTPLVQFSLLFVILTRHRWYKSPRFFSMSSVQTTQVLTSPCYH